MNVVHLTDLQPWTTDDDNQAARDRFRLLAIVARQLGIVGARLSPRQWQLAAVPVDHLGQLRDAIETEGTRTDRRAVPIGAGRRFQTVVRHPARARQTLLDRIDTYSVSEVG